MATENTAASELDHAALLAEIEEDVRQRRLTGELPAELERKLDLVFARYAPVHVIDGDFGQVLERAEQVTYIDVLAPTDAAYPVVPQVKRVVRKAILWVIRYVAAQASGFNETITRAVRLLGRRVDAIEDALPALIAGPAPARGVSELPDQAHWSAALPELLGPVSGRVLVAGAGAAALLAALAGAGYDVYAADPTGVDGGDQRDDALLVHLRKVAPSGLGAVILAGVLDRMPLNGKQHALDAAVERLGPNGRLVVIGADPRAWDADRSAIDADLSPGRPVRTATWVHLLERRGLTDVIAAVGPKRAGLADVPDAGPALKANLQALDELLFPPGSVAVVGTVQGQ